MYICTIVPRSHGWGIEGYFRIFLDDFEQKNGWTPWTSQRNWNKRNDYYMFSSANSSPTINHLSNNYYQLKYTIGIPG